MNTLWTPGPWWAKPIPGSYKQPFQIMAGETIIAQCVGDQLTPEATSIGKARGNARLIAASPELYAASEEQHDVIDRLLAMLIERDHTFYPSKTPGVLEAIQHANAARAKARGEQP